MPWPLRMMQCIYGMAHHLKIEWTRQPHAEPLQTRPHALLGRCVGVWVSITFYPRLSMLRGESVAPQCVTHPSVAQPVTATWHCTKLGIINWIISWRLGRTCSAPLCDHGAALGPLSTQTKCAALVPLSTQKHTVLAVCCVSTKPSASAPPLNLGA